VEYTPCSVWLRNRKSFIFISIHGDCFNVFHDGMLRGGRFRLISLSLPPIVFIRFGFIRSVLAWSFRSFGKRHGYNPLILSPRYLILKCLLINSVPSGHLVFHETIEAFKPPKALKVFSRILYTNSRFGLSCCRTPWMVRHSRVVTVMRYKGMKAMLLNR
jgi:hypothetical protein